MKINGHISKGKGLKAAELKVLPSFYSPGWYLNSNFGPYLSGFPWIPPILPSICNSLAEVGKRWDIFVWLRSLENWSWWSYLHRRSSCGRWDWNFLSESPDPLPDPSTFLLMTKVNLTSSVVLPLGKIFILRYHLSFLEAQDRFSGYSPHRPVRIYTLLSAINSVLCCSWNRKFFSSGMPCLISYSALTALICLSTRRLLEAHGTSPALCAAWHHAKCRIKHLFH